MIFFFPQDPLGIYHDWNLPLLITQTGDTRIRMKDLLYFSSLSLSGSITIFCGENTIRKHSLWTILKCTNVYVVKSFTCKRTLNWTNWTIQTNKQTWVQNECKTTAKSRRAEKRPKRVTKQTNKQIWKKREKNKTWKELHKVKRRKWCIHAIKCMLKQI